MSYRSLGLPSLLLLLLSLYYYVCELSAEGFQGERGDNVRWEVVPNGEGRNENLYGSLDGPD